MSIIGSIIAGIVVGVLARLVLPGKQNISVLITIVLGILGALIGWWIAGLLGVETTDGPDWIRWLISIIVAAGLIVGYGAITGKKQSSDRSSPRMTRPPSHPGRERRRVGDRATPGWSGGQPEARHAGLVLVGEPGEHLPDLGEVDPAADEERRHRVALDGDGLCLRQGLAEEAAPHSARRPPAVRSVLRVSRTTPTTKSACPSSPSARSMTPRVSSSTKRDISR